MKFLLLMLPLWALASDANIHRVDDGLYTEGRTGVAYLPVALETGWYVEALDRTGAMVLDRRIVGAELTEKDAVTIAVQARRAQGPVFEVVISESRTVTVARSNEVLEVSQSR